MFKNPRRVFILLLLLTIIVTIIDLPENYRLAFSLGPLRVDRTINPPSVDRTIAGKKVTFALRTHLGLDLSGGSHVALEANMKDIPVSDRASALESAKQVIERRVNFFGVSEPIVQSARSGDQYRIIVELPGVTDVANAVSLIGQTARLEFREFSDPNEATEGALVIPFTTNTTPTGLSGKDLKNARLDYSTETGKPQVSIEFTADGGKKFGELTSRLVGKTLPIFLDELPLTWPRVQTAITDGRAVITGEYSLDSAKTLALQLNAGALPVPVSVVENRTVGATLGQTSITKSIRAGIVGLIIVGIFMIAQYGRLGFLAVSALILYGLINFALFRLIPVTMTLPGVAGFLLSIGMAVDSNILIFERFKEEKRKGKPWYIAMELGFGKAWESIRDANFTTLITCVILFNPGNWSFIPSSGLVRGFAATLFLGVITSLFTGIVVTRTFIRVFYKEKIKN